MRNTYRSVEIDIQSSTCVRDRDIRDKEVLQTNSRVKQRLHGSICSFLFLADGIKLGQCLGAKDLQPLGNRRDELQRGYEFAEAVRKLFPHIYKT